MNMIAPRPDLFPVTLMSHLQRRKQAREAADWLCLVTD